MNSWLTAYFVSGDYPAMIFNCSCRRVYFILVWPTPIRKIQKDLCARKRGTTGWFRYAHIGANYEPKTPERCCNGFKRNAPVTHPNLVRTNKKGLSVRCLNF